MDSYGFVQLGNLNHTTKMYKELFYFGAENLQAKTTSGDVGSPYGFTERKDVKKLKKKKNKS